MTDIVFRRATADDLPAMVAMLANDNLGEAREAPGLPLDDRYTDAFAAIEADPNQLLAVADDGGTVVGCLQITFLPGIARTGMWRGQIEGVRVADSRRGAGLGRHFIEWAVERCREKGCGLVQLTSDKQRADAIRFYETLGFTASHEGLKIGL